MLFCLKLLGALWHLARGNCWDNIEEFSDANQTTQCTFALAFFRIMVDHMYLVWVKVPQTAADIEACMQPFILMGLDRTFCSSDGVHIMWDWCPVGKTSSYKGKETFPTRAYNVCVRHDKTILHCE